MSRTLCAVAAALLLATIRISAHHAFAAEYDENKRVTVSGIVTKFEWINPHAWLYVDGKDENEKVVSWGFEMGSPNGLLHRGWRRTELKKGDQAPWRGIARRTAGTWPTPAPSPCPTGGNYSAASNHTRCPRQVAEL
jgi:Family of unknown function (DUF6152)